MIFLRVETDVVLIIFHRCRPLFIRPHPKESVVFVIIFVFVVVINIDVDNEYKSIFRLYSVCMVKNA